MECRRRTMLWWQSVVIAISIFSWLSPIHAQSELTISTDFEGGSARVVAIDSQNRTIRITPNGEPSRGWVCWWFFRVNDTEPGKSLTIEVAASDQPTRNKGQLSKQPLAAGWSMPARAAISHDGRTWLHSALGVRENNTIRYEVTPAAKSLWVAWGPPFTPRDTAELLTKATSKIRGAKEFTLAQSRAGRPVMGLTIAPESVQPQANRPAIWIQARQHAWESGSSWVARGIVEWLIVNDKSAHWLRENAEITIVPIMDVDNVATGNGGKEEDPRDHNRDWDDAPVFPEVAAAQQAVQKWSTQGRMDFFIDLHNPAPNDPKPFFFCGPPEFLSDVGRNNQAMFFEIAHKHIQAPLAVETTPRITGPSYHPLWRKISGQWVTDHGNDHTVAVCLETAWNTSHSTTEGYLTVGRQLGETISEYLQRRKK